MKAALLKDGKGTNIKNLNQQILSSLKIPLPPVQTQELFSELMHIAEKREVELQQMLRTLEKKYKGMLKKRSEFYSKYSKISEYYIFIQIYNPAPN